MDDQSLQEDRKLGDTELVCKLAVSLFSCPKRCFELMSDIWLNFNHFESEMSDEYLESKYKQPCQSSKNKPRGQQEAQDKSQGATTTTTTTTNTAHSKKDSSSEEPWNDLQSASTLFEQLNKSFVPAYKKPLAFIFKFLSMIAFGKMQICVDQGSIFWIKGLHLQVPVNYMTPHELQMFEMITIERKQKFKKRRYDFCYAFLDQHSSNDCLFHLPLTCFWNILLAFHCHLMTRIPCSMSLLLCKNSPLSIFSGTLEKFYSIKPIDIHYYMRFQSEQNECILKLLFYYRQCVVELCNMVSNGTYYSWLENNTMVDSKQILHALYEQAVIKSKMLDLIRLDIERIGQRVNKQREYREFNNQMKALLRTNLLDPSFVYSDSNKHRFYSFNKSSQEEADALFNQMHCGIQEFRSYCASIDAMHD
jgi:hypothetical protein